MNESTARSGLYTRERYLFRMPRRVPADFEIVVHNHVRRVSPWHPPGLNGFRIWAAYRTSKYIVCRCGWAPHLGKHYRVKGVDR